MDQSHKSSKRKLENDDDTGGSHNAMIERMLTQSYKPGFSRDADQSLPSQPVIQDLEPGPTKPAFELPDFSGSSSLLERVQKFLPLLNQANASLDSQAPPGFELVEQPDEDESGDEEQEEQTINTRDASDSEDDLVDETIEQDGRDQRQIVMDLALGVFEQRKREREQAVGRQDKDNSESDTTSGDDSDSADSSDGGSEGDQNEALEAVVGDIETEDAKGESAGGQSGKVSSGTKGPSKKVLIEEMS